VGKRTGLLQNADDGLHDFFLPSNSPPKSLAEDGRAMWRQLQDE